MAAQKSQKGANNVVLRRKIYRQLLDWKHDRNGGTKRFAEYITSPTVLHADDYKLEDGVSYLPLYMTPLL